MSLIGRNAETLHLHPIDTCMLKWGRRGWQFAVSSCFWNGLTVFGRKNDGFTVPLFLKSFQISSQNMSGGVILSQN